MPYGTALSQFASNLSRKFYGNLEKVVVNVVGMTYNGYVRMTMNNNPDFMNDYSRGMEMLHLYSGAFATFAGRLGYPIPNPNIPTARVVLNIDTKRISFEINPALLRDLDDSKVAAVIGHETYHVLLNHLNEIGDRKAYPRHDVLVDAQECIINDGLPANIGFEIIDGAFRGPERHGQDFSLFSTREGYDFIMKKLEEESDENEDQDQSDSGDSGDQGESNESDTPKESADKGDEPDESGENSDGDDESDKGKGDESGDEGADDGEGSSANGSQDADAENEGSDAGDSEGADGHADSHSSGYCGGVTIEGEGLDSLDPEELKDLINKILEQEINEALDEVDGDKLPSHIEDMLDELESNSDIELPGRANSNQAGGYGSGSGKDGFNTISAVSGMSMNWVNLLAKINPKIKSSGRPKTRDSWHRAPRRMMHSYPKVILPVTQRQDDPNNKKGDSVPTFILALDMSGSIPTKFLSDLASFACSLPEKLIKGYPITWSNSYRVFDPENPTRIVDRAGTRIETVMSYAAKIKSETGVEPYVLVITDGEFSIPAYADLNVMKTKWFWMALTPGDVAKINRNIPQAVTPTNVLRLVDFI